MSPGGTSPFMPQKSTKRKFKPEKTDAEKIAIKIYQAKGYIYDNESDAINAVKSIKNETQLEQVEQQLIKLTDGRGLGEYLVSFLDNFNENKVVLDHLMNISSPLSYAWTVYPYGDKVFSEYRSELTNEFGIERFIIKWISPEFRKQLHIGINPADLAPIKMLTMMPHEILTGLAFATSFIPIIGLLVSSGFMLIDSYAYYKQDNKQAAGLAGLFALLPGIGAIVTRIPIVKKLTANVAAKIASKIVNKQHLTPKEEVILHELIKNQDIIKKELELVLPVMKQLYADNLINEWLKTLTPTEIATIKSKVLNGTYKFDDILDLSRKSINPTYAITQGIKFSAGDLFIADLLVKAAKRKGLMSTKFVTKTPKNQSITVTMEVVDIKKAYPEAWKQGYKEAWAEPKRLGYPENKIVFDVNYIKQTSEAQIESFIVHELAHIKDPSFVSPKLTARYSPRDKNLPAYTSWNLSKDPADAGKTFWNTYYHHPFEINAITPQVLGHMVKTTKLKGSVIGKQKTLSALNQIENWIRGIDTAWSDDAADIIGYDRADIKIFFDTMSEKNPAGYKKLQSQIAKQISNLKTQTNKLSEWKSISRATCIKLKNLL